MKLVASVIILLSLSPVANAQKKGKAAEPVAAKATGSVATPAGPEAVGAGAGSDKLDITDLENKYWTPKDTAFTVVQNRTYTKAKRFSLLASYGKLLNDGFTDSDNITISGNYFLSERYGFEVTYNKATPKDSNVVTATRNLNGNNNQLMPDHGEVTGYVGGSFNWVPFYAKMSFLESKILYFDIMFSPGAGMTQYTQKYGFGDIAGKQSVTLSFDVAQQIFLNEHFAIRLDFRNRWFKEDVLKFKPTTDTKEKLRTETTHNSTLQIGLTYFF